MRAAWPSVAGRCCVSFCRTSLDKPPHPGVVERLRQPGLLVAPLPLDLLVLPIDVAGVLRLHVDLQRNLVGEPLVEAPVVGATAQRGIERLVGNFGPAQHFERALLA